MGVVSIAGACAQQIAPQLTPKLQNAIGHWQVVNSDGSPGGHVDTYLENGKLFGRVTEVRPGRTPQDVCDKCSGEYKNQLILGMLLMRNFHAAGRRLGGWNGRGPGEWKGIQGQDLGRRNRQAQDARIYRHLAAGANRELGQASLRRAAEDQL